MMRLTENTNITNQIKDRNFVHAKYTRTIFNRGIPVKTEFAFTINFFGKKSAEIAGNVLFGVKYLMIFRYDGYNEIPLPIFRRVFEIESAYALDNTLHLVCTSAYIPFEKQDAENISAVRWRFGTEVGSNSVNGIAMYELKN